MAFPDGVSYDIVRVNDLKRTPVNQLPAILYNGHPYQITDIIFGGPHNKEVITVMVSRLCDCDGVSSTLGIDGYTNLQSVSPVKQYLVHHQG